MVARRLAGQKARRAKNVNTTRRTDIVIFYSLINQVPLRVVWWLKQQTTIAVPQRYISFRISALFLSYSAFVISPFFRRSSSFRRRSSADSAAWAVVPADAVPEIQAFCSPGSASTFA